MNVQRSLWLALPFAFLLPLGCAGTTQPGQEPEATETTTAAAVAAAAPTTEATPAAATQGHHAHFRGPADMLLHAARDLDLSAAQRTSVDNLAAQLHGDHAARTSQHQAFRSLLADGVRAGKIDASVLTPLETEARTEGQAHVQRETTALDGLWAALEPAQRTALVAKVHARQAEHTARWAEHREEGAEAGGWGQEKLAHLTSQLGLDASQQATVSGILASDRPAPAAMQAMHTQMKTREEALLTAFASDAFDASTLVGSPPAGAGVGPEQRHVQFLTQLVPILGADQRETLASSMETARD